MATEKVLKTRIQLKYDTLANWTTNSSLVLKKGEIGLVEIPSGNTTVTTAPTILFKVGDGKTAFSALNWASALSADVYAWAKKTGIDIVPSGSGDFVTAIAWDSTNNRINVTKGTAVKQIKINSTTISPTNGVVDLGKVITDVSLGAGSANGSLKLTVNGTAGTDVKVTGLGDLAYKDSLTKADVGLGSVVNAGRDTTPTADSNNYITSGGVKSYVDSAISGVTQFKYEVVDTLPTASASTMGKIYLTKHEHGTQDGYDEFITIELGTTTKTYKWEKIGNTDIDLTDYVNTLSGTATNGVLTGLTKDGNKLEVTSTSLSTTIGATSGQYISAITQSATGKISATKANLPVNTNQTVKVGTTTFSENAAVEILGDGQAVVTADSGKNQITVSVTGVATEDSLTTVKDELSGRITTLEAKPGLDKVGTVTSVSAGTGLKVTGTASVSPKVEIDDTVIFILDGGSSTDVI